MSAASEESQISELEVPDEEKVKAKPPKKFARRYGSRYEVFDAQTAFQTRGGLKKEDLMLSRTGKIVSKKKSEAAKKLYQEYGFNKRTKAKPKKKSSPPKTKKPRKKRKAGSSK